MAIDDIVYRFKKTYRAAPPWVRFLSGHAFALLPRRFRYGSIFQRQRRLLEESQRWSWQEHRQYQWRLMEALLRHVYETVPYYRRAMEQAQLTPADFHAQEDWCKLPLLSKETIRLHRDELVAEGWPRFVVNTGGSTGQPLELYWERGRTRSLEHAFMCRQYEWGGFRAGQRTAVLRGQTAGSRLWLYDPVDRHLFLNAYNISEQSGRQMVDKLRKFRPVSIQGYPSAISVLAGWMDRHGEGPIESIKVVLCGSESLYPEQKALLERVFKARAYSWYGHTECCCLAGYCDLEPYYHVYSEYGYTELVDAEGRTVPWEPGNRGEIVSTSLINDTMPLIRYRTGDIGIVGPRQCRCGRNYPLLERIEGREQDYVITRDGRAIPLTGLVFGQHWHAFARMRQFQLVQDRPGEVLLQIVKQADFGPEDEAEIRRKVQAAVQHGLEISFGFVDQIPTTKQGKRIFLKQSLDVRQYTFGR